jgi:glycosyltransferase involved in cell wall biosynthesis
MKLSIITVSLNSEKTIRDTINSVASQNYKNIEHVFVDGGSTDGTLEIIKNNPFKNKKLLIKKRTGIYTAMNEGIKKATGDIIQILNSDDILESNTVIEEVISKIKKNPKYDLYLGNVIFFSEKNYYKIKRYFTSNNFKKEHLDKGSMPPHPASFVRTKVYKECGLYNDKHKIASDFEFFYKTLKVKKLKFKKLNNNIVRMRTGGASGQSLKSYYIITKEIFSSLNSFNVKADKIKIIIRGLFKIKELIFFSQNNLNKKFKLFNIIFEKNFYDKITFKILKKTKSLPFNKNFILSGMNLAFLGYYAKKTLYPDINLYHWPDGIFLKKIINIEKIPGRQLLKQMKVPKKINRINIIGNISNKSKIYMKKRFNKKINHIKLPYASIEVLKREKIKLNKNDLTFITLPTPKQEELAYNFAKLNRNFKIICIGASISIASGEEKGVPKIFQNYEYLWRLRTDFFRRFYRLSETLFYFLYGSVKKNLFNKTIFKIIEK